MNVHDPTSFVDHVHLAFAQRECKRKIIDQCRELFKSRVSVPEFEELSAWEKAHAKTVALSCEIHEHDRKMR